MTSRVTRRMANAIALTRGRLHGAPRTLIRPGVRLVLERGATLEVGQRLDLGQPWSRGRHYPSELIVREGGTLRVTSSWRFRTDFRVWVASGATLTLGRGGSNYGAEIVCNHEITIGEGSGLGFGVTIRDDDEHVVTGGSGPGAVRIGDGVLIATGALILPGVTIGDGAMVAARSVVTKDVPPRTLVAGVPARVVRENITWK
jgi:acetyltransferase-like isoleucine patch superfamily enzyme